MAEVPFDDGAVLRKVREEAEQQAWALFAGIAGTSAPFASTYWAAPDLKGDLPIAGDSRLSAPGNPGVIERTAAEEEVWKTIRDQLSHSISLTYDPKSRVSINELFTSIDAGIVVNEDAHVDLPYLHVEVLLDQAGDLLERALRDRAAWEDASRSYLDEVLTFLEAADLEEQKETEIGLGSLNKDWLANAYDWVAAYWDYWAAQSDVAQVVQRVDSVESQPRFDAASSLAFVQAQPQPQGDYETKSGKGTKAQLSASLTETIMSVDQAREKADLQRQLSSTDMRRVASAYRTQKLHAISPAISAEADGRYARYRISRQYRDLRSYSLAHPNGVLNRRRRLDELSQRITLDVNEAIARVQSADRGMRSLFGFQEAAPSVAARPELIGELIVWVRKAIQRQIRFTRADQATLVTISLRSLIGEAEWTSFMDGKRVAFEVTAERLENMRYARLRGISAAYSVADEGRVLDSLMIIPPDKARYLTNNQDVEIDQTYLKPVILGKVVPTIDSKDPPVCGSVSLFNASPIGIWHLNRHASVGVSKGVEDLLIELHVSYQG